MKYLSKLLIAICLSFGFSLAFAQNHIDDNYIDSEIFNYNLNHIKIDSAQITTPEIAYSYYGEISDTTGRPRTNYVNGYYKSNGTYVNPYYRS